MIRTRRRRCRHCSELFFPDPRNRTRQRYCARPECRKASKTASQRKWVKKNPDYFRDPVHVERVRQWRANHPGYARIKKKALQDSLCENIDKKRVVKPTLTTKALQDPLLAQNPVLIGLIANLTGSALQDDIAVSIRGMQQLGADIINHYAQGGNCHDSKNACL